MPSSKRMAEIWPETGGCRRWSGVELRAFLFIQTVTDGFGMMMYGRHGRGSASGVMISSASGGRRPRRAAGQWPTSAKVRQRRPRRSRRGAGGSPGHPVSRPRRPLVSASTQPSGRKKSFHARVAHESHGSGPQHDCRQGPLASVVVARRRRCEIILLDPRSTTAAEATRARRARTAGAIPATAL